jgi:hypothetical protein
VLDRHGLVQHKKPRRQRSHPGPPLPIPNEPKTGPTRLTTSKHLRRSINPRLPLHRSTAAPRVPGRLRAQARRRRQHAALA